MNKNVLGSDLKSCCQSPKTGFYRDGFCRVGPEDGGEHQWKARLHFAAVGILHHLSIH